MGISDNATRLIITPACQWIASKYKIPYERFDRDGEEAGWFQTWGFSHGPQTTDCLVRFSITLMGFYCYHISGKSIFVTLVARWLYQ